jgi:hypothetical protein
MTRLFVQFIDPRSPRFLILEQPSASLTPALRRLRWHAPALLPDNWHVWNKRLGNETIDRDAFTKVAYNDMI